MRGYPEMNFPAFAKYAKQLRDVGHLVRNPAEQDMILLGRPGQDTEADRRLLFGHDTAWICAEANAVAVMPGWEASKGAQAEVALARALGLEVIYLS